MKKLRGTASVTHRALLGVTQCSNIFCPKVLVDDLFSVPFKEHSWQVGVSDH